MENKLLQERKIILSILLDPAIQGVCVIATILALNMDLIKLECDFRKMKYREDGWLWWSMKVKRLYPYFP